MTGRQSDARPMRVIYRPRPSEIKTINKTKTGSGKAVGFSVWEERLIPGTQSGA